jgi:hypothetical protein
MRRLALFVLALLALAAVPLAAGRHESTLPDEIALPNGFAPEGIDIDRHGKFYVGSIPPAPSTAAA